MAGWQCASCETHNDDNQGVCLVCGARKRKASPVVVAPAEPLLPRMPTQPTPATRPESGRRRRRWTAALLSLIVVLLAALLAVQLAGHQPRPVVSDPATTTGQLALPDPTSEDASPAAPPTSPDASASASPAASDSPASGGSGIVNTTAINSDPRAAAVAAMLDTYFSGINAHNYTQALSVFDPAGVLDPNSASEASRFAHDVSTTTDSDVVVQSVADASTGNAALIAVVTFVSHQQSGYGPSGSRNETCTNWRVTYTLTQTGAGGYRILRGEATHTHC